MKRKNKSVQQARAAPDRIVGGADALMNRYDASHSFRNAVADHSYNYAGPPSPSKGTNSAAVSNVELDKRPSTQVRKPRAGTEIERAILPEEIKSGQHGSETVNQVKVEGSQTEQMNAGSVLAISNYVESGAIGSAMDHLSI